MEATGAVVWRSAPDLGLQQARGWTELTGQPAGAAIAQGWLEALHPEDKAAIRSRIEKLRIAPESAEATYRLRHADGGYRWVHARVVPLKDPDGTVREWAGLLNDINDQVEADAALRNSEERLRLALETADVGIWDYEIGSGAGLCSPTKSRILGIPDDFPLGPEAFCSLIHPDDRAQVEEQIGRAFEAEGGGRFSGEFRIVRADNREVRWVRVSARIYFDASGKPVRSIGTIMDVTTNREQQEQTRLSEERHRALVQASSSAMWVAGPDGRVNAVWGWTEMSGQCAPSSSGNGWMESLHPDDAAAVEFQWSAARKSATPFQYEFRLKRPDGQYGWCVSRGVPIKNGDATVREWVGAVTDINARRRAEDDLRAQEERLRLAIEATGLGIWDICLTSGVGEWSAEMFELLGVATSVCPSLELLRSCVHPDDRGIFDGACSHSANGFIRGGTHTFRIIRGESQEERWVQLKGRVISAKEGNAARWIGTLRDVTSEKRSEEALRSSEERYRLIAEHTTDMIARADLDGRRMYVSPSAEELSGYTCQELLSRSVFDEVHPDDYARIVSARSTVAAGRVDRARWSYRLCRKDGTTVPVEVRLQLVRDDAGRPLEIVGLTRDMSEHEKLQRQLRQAQRMEAVGQLTGGIAHDFNNLLTVILGNSEVLFEEVAEPELREAAELVLHAAERGADLTQRLLSFARRQSLQLRAVRAEAVVSGMIPILQRTIGEDIALETKLAAPSATTMADQALLESAILNLVVNARDAMPEGGLITLETGATAAGPNCGELPAGQPIVFISVSDTGHGMSPEIAERAFEPFFTTKEAGRGSGLGLSMVYGLAKQSAGHVGIESTLGVGTRVTIYLRAVSAPECLEEQRRQNAVRGGCEHILLVEDEPDVRRFVEAQLSSLGYEVTATADAAKALEAMKRVGRVDLLLTDVVLPKGLSGVDLAFRARELIPELPVLLTSGYSEDAFRAGARPDSDMALLRKPFKRRDLADAIRTALGSAPKRLHTDAAPVPNSISPVDLAVGSR